MLKKPLFIFGFALTFLLFWFAVSDYRAAAPIAAENLRGLALTLTAAIENAAQQDPSFNALSGFHPADVAFFAVIDRRGVIRYHTNQELIGSATKDTECLTVIKTGSIAESRVLLGTGERAYEFHAPLYVRGEVLALCLTLHTYRADAVVRRARLNLILLASLLVAGWTMTVILDRFAKREDLHRREMAQRESLARLGELGAVLAHEIRNPLAGIKGYAQIIEKRPAEERNARFARGIVSEVVRLEALVSDLLAYARSDGYGMTAVDLKELLAYTVAFVRHEADELAVCTSIECPEGLRITGNRDRLLQVLLNLAKNALQAMPEGGSLRFSGGRSGRHAVLTVSDTGQGISEEHRARLFEPFFTTKARGTGLGLALCKKTVEEHQGTIRVESREGVGTSVIIALPLAPGNRSGRR
jgi:two-component system sensor histidine kinase HydH